MDAEHIFGIGSPQPFDVVSDRYDRYWHHSDGESEIDQDHYTHVRIATNRFYRYLLEHKNITPKDGQVLICGPGFNVANQRDLNPETLGVWMKDHPGIILADFSVAALRSSYNSMLKSGSKVMHGKIAGVRMDFSGGLSAKVDMHFSDKIDNIDSWKQLLEFVEQVGNTDAAIIELQKSGPGPAFDEGKIESEMIEMFSFSNIVQQRGEIHYIITNLLLAGMFATTEQIFREKLLSLAEMNAKSAQEVSYCLSQWHALILRLNNEVSKRFLQTVLTAHPQAHISIVTEKNVDYGVYGEYLRFDIQNIRQRLCTIGIIIDDVATGWKVDHEHEKPPHVHVVKHYCAYRK